MGCELPRVVRGRGGGGWGGCDCACAGAGGVKWLMGSRDCPALSLMMATISNNTFMNSLYSDLTAQHQHSTAQQCSEEVAQQRAREGKARRCRWMRAVMSWDGMPTIEGEFVVSEHRLLIAMNVLCHTTPAARTQHSQYTQSLRCVVWVSGVVWTISDVLFELREGFSELLYVLPYRPPL